MGWSDFWSDVGENLSNIFGGASAQRRNAAKQLTDYRDAINKYTGSEAYQNALKQASKETANIAGQQTSQAIANQQTALRNSGQSGNAAAILAGNNASNVYQNAYNQNLVGQQNAAYNAGLSRLDAESGYNNALNGNAQNNANASGKTMQNITSLAGRGLELLSDENSKKAITTDEFFKKYKPRRMKDLSVSFGRK